MGIWPMKAPIGYINDSKTKSIQIDSETSKAVKKAFELFAEGGRSFSEISLFLNRFNITRGWRSKNNKPLHINQIKKMLTNRFYIGILNYNGEYYQGSHKLFITKKLFDEVQKQVQRIEKPRQKGHDFAFRGLARCGECNCAITGEQHIKKYKNGTNQTFIYYRCTKKIKPCSQKYISEPELEGQVRKIVSDCALPQEWAGDWYIGSALSCAKIARAKNTDKDLVNLVKTVGSNFFLLNRQLQVQYNQGFAALCAPPPAQRNFSSSASKSLSVPRTGVEPVISGMKARCPRPLDERGNLAESDSA